MQPRGGAGAETAVRLRLLLSIWVTGFMQGGVLQTNETNFGKCNIQDTFDFSVIPKCLFHTRAGKTKQGRITYAHA